MSRLTKEQLETFTHVNYAHRGLYLEDQTVPENSLAAFRRAAEKGYGVELDVQVSKDGQVMVFHDDNLKRMTGKDANIWDLTFDELRELRLKGTDEQIPLFTEVLGVLKTGAGPLVCELKTGPRNNELCEKTTAILRTYDRPYVIESFHPFIVNWFRKNAPDIVRGQLVSDQESYSEMPKWQGNLLYKAGFSFLNKPDFIARKFNAPIPKSI